MRRRRQLGLALLIVCACAPVAIAQPVIQFPTSPAPATPNTINATPARPGVITPPATPAPTFAAPTTSPYVGSGGPFDPYSASGAAPYAFWSSTPPSNTAGAFAQPPPTPYAATTPFTPPPPSPYAGGSFAPPPATGQPQAIFPNGVFNGQTFDYTQSLRFIQDLRFRETWVEGSDDDNDLDINDIEAALTFTLPNFLTTGQPLYISPAFALHLWDGPRDMSADLPPQAYSAYLDFQWSSDPLLQIGAELGFRAGVFTDFDTLNSDSLRLQGLALGTARLTPNLVMKLGVVYLDRNDIKLLPAGGFLWTPTPQVRFDIFFPQPKLAFYLTTIGQYEVWSYVAGEYGGGAWTIERASGSTDRVDINDIRVSSGIEWTGPRGLTGFLESGFVFNREVVYVVDPDDSFDASDSFMLRGGFSF